MKKVKRKPRSDKGKPRGSYKNNNTPTNEPTPEQITTPIKEQTTPTENNSIKDLFDTDEIFKEFTAYEPPSEEPNDTNEEKPKKEKAHFEDDWLDEEDEADEDETGEYGTNPAEKNWAKFAVRTIKKVDFIRALGLSFYGGESLKKYLEYENIKENDDLVLDVAEVMKNYQVEMKPEYSIALTFLVGTTMLIIEAREDRKRNELKKNKANDGNTKRQ